jgi:glycerol-3-phosphate dehydrogenase
VSVIRGAGEVGGARSENPRRSAAAKTAPQKVEEENYLLTAYFEHFPNETPKISGRFSGLRPLIKSSNHPSNLSRESIINRNGKILTILGGKWTTAIVLAKSISKKL